MDKLIKAMFPNLEGVWKEMNLNSYTESLEQGTFNEWVISYGGDYLWGGWMEDREVVLAYTYLPSGGRIHLGAKIGVVAPFESNGGWHPHLHLQCMRTLNVDVDGYSKRYDGMEYDFPNPGEVWK